MVSTIRYSANASSDHHPNQAPGILIIMNPKQHNLPTCSVTSTLFHLLSNPSLHLIANTTLGIIMTAIKISPKTLNHSILSTITNFDFLNSPNLNFINSRIKNSIYVYCPVNYFKFLTKNTCLSIEFKLCFCKFFCKEIFMNISPVRKTSVSFPFLVSVFL